MKSELSFVDSIFKIRQMHVSGAFFLSSQSSFLFLLNYLDACKCPKDIKLSSERLPWLNVVGGPMQPLGDGAEPRESVDKCHFL